MNVVAVAAEVRKAIASAVAVASVILVTEGVPATWKGVAASVVAVGAVFGIVYKVPNRKA